MKIRAFLAILCALTVTTAATAQRKPRLKQADLLFHVAGQGNAITDVTPGMIDHVAICLGSDSVIEAIPQQGVTTTALNVVLSREEGYYIVGRVKKADRRRSAEKARHYIGCRYDSLYLPDNADIYCSELVVLALVDKKGNRLFEPIPMSFHDSTGAITPYWKEFYERHGLPVPEGWPGSNPGELSRRRQVCIVGRLGY